MPESNGAEKRWPSRLRLYARRVHEPLTRKLGGRPSASAMITVSLLLVIALPIVAVVTSIVIDADGELYLYSKGDGIIRAVVEAIGF